jgi:Uma2 family endonuclease
MHALQRPLTYDDLFAMPDDGQRRELIGGDLIVNPAPRRIHQEIAGNVYALLRNFLHAAQRGRAYMHPVDVYVGRNDVVQPDVIAIRHDRLRVYRPEGAVVEPPDIVVEIISPSTQRIDRVSKMALYARFGVPEYWIIDPEERTIVANSLEVDAYETIQPEDDGVISSRVFPGLRVDPAAVFSGLDE